MISLNSEISSFLPCESASTHPKTLRRREPGRRGSAWRSSLGILGLIKLWPVGRGGTSTNAPRVHLTLFFRSTVHGVDVGSPVKILGVPVGQIEALGVRLPDEMKSPIYYAEVKGRARRRAASPQWAWAAPPGAGRVPLKR